MTIPIEIPSTIARIVAASTRRIVTGIATPIHLGKKTQVWGIKITDESGNLMCLSRHTVAVLPQVAARHMKFELPKLD